MKTIPTLLLLAGLAAASPLIAADPPAAEPTPAAPTNAEPTAPAILPAPAPAVAPTNAVVADLATTNAVVVASTNYNPADGLRLNFRGVPLEMVLNYLSDAAGFVIVLDTPVSGKVDVWSNTPVTKEEAVSLLNSVLNKNGYAAIRNGRTLTIVSRDAAKTRDIPVKRGSEPNDIPKNDEIVTQIIPVRYINAAQLTKDLMPLQPTSAQMTANESGNALVITDTQSNIRRMAEIVKALDTSVANASTIRVYPLKFADAKTVATVMKDLFQQQDSGQRNANDLRAQFFQRMGGGGGPFSGGGGGGGDGGGRGGGGGGNNGGGNARTQQPKVVATSDDRSNSLVVSAPDEMIPTIDEFVAAIDKDVEDFTEVKVFRLKYSDPVEMADLLGGLFPDETRNNDNNNGGRMRFGGGGFGGAAGANNAAKSDRMKKMSRVLAVADQRTSSVIVSTSHELMIQIEAMIEQLDANPAKKQKVFVYSLENADVQEVEQILRDMFDRNGTMNSRNSKNTQSNPLNTRSTQQQQQNNTGMGGGSGGSRGLGGSGGLSGGNF